MPTLKGSNNLFGRLAVAHLYYPYRVERIDGIPESVGVTSNARQNSSMFGCVVCIPVAQFRSSGRVPKPRSGDRFIARGETAGPASDRPENPGRGET